VIEGEKTTKIMHTSPSLHHLMWLYQYILKDGTKLRLRPVITEVRKLRRVGLDGKPVYSIKAAIVQNIHHPDKAEKES